MSSREQDTTIPNNVTSGLAKALENMTAELGTDGSVSVLLTGNAWSSDRSKLFEKSLKHRSMQYNMIEVVDMSSLAAWNSVGSPVATQISSYLPYGRGGAPRTGHSFGRRTT